MEDESPVRWSGARAIASSLNRPKQLNAFNEACTRRSARAPMREDATRSDADQCRPRLLPARICANAYQGQPKRPGIGALETYYNPLVRKLRALPFPVVAAVNGVAAGAGANIALACDVVLAARSASFVQAFSKIGLVPDSGGTWFLPRLVGPARARGMALTGDPLPADKAEAWGLIWKMHDDLVLMAEAHRLCVHFTEAPTVALALIKRLLDESWANDLDSQLDLERETQREASLTPDYAEGMRAFFEKRAPAFSGRKSS